MADALLTKLNLLEAQLQKLVVAAKEDLELAKGLQKLLTPNRLPKIAGVDCVAKHVSALGLSSDGFEIQPAKTGRSVDILMYWTESYGLSSVLLQSLIHFSLKTKDSELLKVSELFEFLSSELNTAKKSGQFKLLIARLELHTLKLSGLAQGLQAPFTKARGSNSWLPCAKLGLHDDEPQAFQTQLSPGSSLLFLGSAWAAHELTQVPSDPSASLLDDMNQIAVEMQKILGTESSDLSLVGVHIDSKKLHLA
jgi:hypothetical protein